MKYIVKTKAKDNITDVYYVDRKLCKDKWWSENINLAFKFDNMEKANEVKNKLKYGNPKVQMYNETIKEPEKKENNNNDIDKIKMDIREEIFKSNAFEISERKCELCKRRYYYNNGLYQCICGCVD